MKKSVYVALLVISLAIAIGTIIFLGFNKKREEITNSSNNNNNISAGDKISFQIIQRDINSREEKIVSEKEIKLGGTLTKKEDMLGIDTTSDIRILEVNSSSVKISRDKVKYQIDEENETVNDSSEEIVEELEYGTTFSLEISEKKPCYPNSSSCQNDTEEQYNYYGVFVKS